MDNIFLILFSPIIVWITIYGFVVAIRDFKKKRLRNSFTYNNLEIEPEQVLASGTTDSFSYTIYYCPIADKLVLYTGGNPVSHGGKLYISPFYTVTLDKTVDELDTITDEYLVEVGYNTYMNAAK